MIELNADSIKISGPKVDGGYTVTLSVGEYEQKKLAELLLIPQNTNITVKFEYDRE